MSALRGDMPGDFHRRLSCRRAPPEIVELMHDPEKWKPVFRKDHAPIKN
jgi:hypothetical protein